MGFTLYHAAFGFTGAYRRLIQDRDLSGLIAQFVTLGVAMVLFAPTLAAGEAFEHGVGGALAPVGVSMAFVHCCSVLACKQVGVCFGHLVYRWWR
jgi:hypothetical protein